MAAWAAARWQERPAGSQEEAVAALLREAGAEILSLKDLWGQEAWNKGGPRPTSERPWEAAVAGQRVYIYVDASEGEGSGGGIVVDVGAQRWVQHYPFPRGVDNTTGELIMQAIGHEVVREARRGGRRRGGRTGIRRASGRSTGSQGPGESETPPQKGTGGIHPAIGRAVLVGPQPPPTPRTRRRRDAPMGRQWGGGRGGG